MSTLPKKVSGYEKRKQAHASTLVPLELDSDSDFNPGAYVPETSKKRGRASTGSKKAGEPSSKKRKTADKVDGRTSRTGRLSSDELSDTKEAIPLQRNLLVELFGCAGILPVEESEPEADDEEEEEREDEEPDDDYVPKPSAASLFAVPLRPAKSTHSQSTTPDEDSVTEPESDEFSEGGTWQPKQPKFAASKVTRNPPRTTQVDDSVTEPEPEPSDWMDVNAPPRAKFSKPNFTKSAKKFIVPSKASISDLSGSETEPELEDEENEEFLKLRPEFPLEDGQPKEGPLRLDSRHWVPERVNTFLRDYQRAGIRFFWDRWKESKGGLLGDDMGLGKTIQVISFLSAIMRKQGSVYDLSRRRKHVSKLQDKDDWKKYRSLPPANSKWPTCLVIAPNSVVGNWEREFETWGYFEVGMYIGPPAARKDVLNEFKLGRLDVLITSFDVARMDIDLIDELPWSCIFIDEVHRVKNPKSKLAEAFSRFKCSCRFGLSGTVIQNGYEELWTVLNWTNPGAVGTRKQWKTFVEEPLRIGQSRSATEDEQYKAALVAKTLTEKLLPQLFLRRTKQIIQKQLPKKTDQVVFCPLTPMQLEVYKRILSTEDVKSLIDGDTRCDCGSNKQRKKCCHPVQQGDLFKYMSTLIKISNHLALILPSPTDSQDQAMRNRELARLAFPADKIPKYGTAMLCSEFCGKWHVLHELLKKWKRARTNKVLIFTKSVKLLEMLEYQLEDQGYSFLKLDGSTKQADRMPMVDKFQEDSGVFVFLISTMAGGTGLNLTAANKVVIFDPNWNPAHDLQAMDRAYRFGQLRDVSVYRLLGAGSIEELIYARQVYKQQQMEVGYNASLQTRYFEGVQGDKKKQGELFGIKNIFRLHEHTLATKQAIESANVSDVDWAFAFMGTGGVSAAKRPKSKPAGVRWVYEEEAKGGHEYNDLRGLGALLLDDDTPEVTHPLNDIEKTLSTLGVKYTHRNDDLIAESTIEGQRMRKLIEDKKKAAKRKKHILETGRPEPVWPPIRGKNRKPQLTSEEKLRIRKDALVERGIIQSPEEYSHFAQEFKKMPYEEQVRLLKELDAHHKAKSD